METLAFLCSQSTLEKYQPMNTPLNYQFMESPVGRLRLVSNGAALERIEFENLHAEDGIEQSDPVIESTKKQLGEYFQGSRTRFSLPLAADGTGFQHSVWSALQEIPFGELRSYQDIAIAIGNKKAVRAVGAANGRNPIPIVVPCHRVIGRNGKLTGFAGGLKAKHTLLVLEGSTLL
jgi:methylated-DNA-[protein]-cysteine S-methyltransferase